AHFHRLDNSAKAGHEWLDLRSANLPPTPLPPFLPPEVYRDRVRGGTARAVRFRVRTEIHNRQFLDARGIWELVIIIIVIRGGESECVVFATSRPTAAGRLQGHHGPALCA